MVSLSTSVVLAGSLDLLLIGGMQIARPLLICTKPSTFLAGYLASLVFLLTLTVMSNIQMLLFGQHFQAQYVEIVFSLVLAMFVAASIDRIAVTSCLFCSLLTLYYLNERSHKVYHANNNNNNVGPIKKKK